MVSNRGLAVGSITISHLDGAYALIWGVLRQHRQHARGNQVKGSPSASHDRVPQPELTQIIVGVGGLHLFHLSVGLSLPWP